MEIEVAKQNNNIVYNLDKGYQITRIAGQECRMVLRDKTSAPLATMELCKNKISSVRPYPGTEQNSAYLPFLQKFVRSRKFNLTEDAAADLKFNIVIRDGQERYYTAAELTNKRLNRFFKNFDRLEITLNHYKAAHLHIPSTTKICRLNLSHADVRKLTVNTGAHCNLDLRDNRSVKTLIIQNSFNGTLNFSRSHLQKITIGDNCRSHISCTHSSKCFSMRIGDVYSGELDLRDSCFHRLSIGYYCYAVIRLSENWGRKDLSVGDSFRGALLLDSVQAQRLKIGDDCRGRVAVHEQDRQSGLRRLEIMDDFQGEVDLENALVMEHVEFGNNASGRVNLAGCPSVKCLKFDEDFCGDADLRDSGVIYVRAKDGCRGRFVLLNCDNLSLLRLPRDRRSSVMIEKMPKFVNTDERNFYYHFSEDKLPSDLSTPIYRHWYKNIKRFLKKHLPA